MRHRCNVPLIRCQQAISENRPTSFTGGARQSQGVPSSRKMLMMQSRDGQQKWNPGCSRKGHQVASETEIEPKDIGTRLTYSASDISLLSFTARSRVFGSLPFRFALMQRCERTFTGSWVAFSSGYASPGSESPPPGRCSGRRPCSRSAIARGRWPLTHSPQKEVVSGPAQLGVPTPRHLGVLEQWR